MVKPAAKAVFDPIRTLAFGGISGSYASVGSALEYPARLVKISNNTEGDLYFTTDTDEDQIFVAAGSFALYDFQSNMNPNKDDSFVIPAGAQFSVKQITAPTSGSVYIEVVRAGA